jgi:hypothetical protein
MLPICPSAHQRQAARMAHIGRQCQHPLPVGRRCLAHPAGEEGAEASQAGEADLHAYPGHRVASRREQLAGPVQASLDPVLVRGGAEHRLKLADEMERRDPHLPRQVGDGGRIFPSEEEFAGPAEAAEAFVAEEHQRASVSRPWPSLTDGAHHPGISPFSRSTRL